MMAHFLILIVIWFSPALYLIRFSILGIPTTVLEISIYLLFINYYLLIIYRKEKFHWPDRQWLWPIGLFILGTLIGVIISPDKRVALGQFKGLIFDPILLGWVIYTAIQSKVVKRDLIVYSLIGSGVWLSIGHWLFSTDPQGRAWSIYAFDVNPSANYLALYLSPIAVMTIILGIFNFQFSIFNKFSIAQFKKASYFLLGGLMVVGVFLSGSRGGLLGLSVGTLVGLILLSRSKILKISLTCLTFLTLLTALWITRPNLKVSPDSGRIASSNNIRYEIWTTTKEILTQNTKNFIFGIGLGNYQNYFTELTRGRVNYPEFIAPKALTPHNIFLAMWVNGGLLMLVSFIWILALYFKTLFNPSGINPKSEFEIRHFNIVSVAAMVALLVHGLVDTPYFKNDLSILFWVLVALAIISVIQTKKDLARVRSTGLIR